MSRIPTLSLETATGKSQQLLQTVQNKLGMVPNLMKVLANSPAALEAYLQFSGALQGGVLPAKTREQIALTVGQANSCQYCLSAHSALGKKAGLTPEQVRDARLGHATDDKSQTILQFANKIVDQRGRVTDDDLAELRQAGVTDAEIAEIVANTALNIFTNYFNHVTDPVVDFPAAEELQAAAS